MPLAGREDVTDSTHRLDKEPKLTQAAVSVTCPVELSSVVLGNAVPSALMTTSREPTGQEKID